MTKECARCSRSHRQSAETWQKLVQHTATWHFRPIIVLGKWKMIYFSTIVFVCVTQPFMCDLKASCSRRVGVVGSGLVRWERLIPSIPYILALSSDL